MAKRVSLAARRAQDRKGVDLLLGADAPGAAGEEKPALAKTTMYVRAEQVAAVEDIRHAERQRGRRVSLSELYTEALDLLIAKYGGQG